MNILIVSLSPHVHGGDSVQKNMYGALIALSPAIHVSLYFFGLGALIVTATYVAACLFFEWAIGPPPPPPGAPPRAKAESGAMPKLMSLVASGSDRLVEATADEAKPTSGMATWMVASSWSESAASLMARSARVAPSSASCSSTARFAVVSAISDIEK